MVQLHTKLRDATPHMENQRTTEKKAMTMAVDYDDGYDDGYKAGSFD